MNLYTTIATFRDLPLAELAKSKLKSEGIYCFLLNNNHIGINWLASLALGGVKLQVKNEDVEYAKTILSKDESAVLENDDLEFPDIEDNDLCSFCGSSNLEYIKYSRLSGALILLTQLPVFFWGIGYKCKDCGKKQHISKI